MAATRFGSLEARTLGAAVWSPLQQRAARRATCTPGSPRRSANDTAGPAAPEPPLYYALEAIPYRLASGATLLDRLALMRLLSALLAGVTALFVFLFVRECLPGRPWAWTVGALGAALHPLLGFVSGGVNPDALLFAICAALFLCARARLPPRPDDAARGLDRRDARGGRASARSTSTGSCRARCWRSRWRRARARAAWNRARAAAASASRSGSRSRRTCC